MGGGGGGGGHRIPQEGYIVLGLLIIGQVVE